MVRLVIYDIKAEFTPVFKAFGLEVGYPDKLQPELMDVGRDVFGETVKMPHVFVDPIDARELEVVEACFGETVCQLIEIPLTGDFGVPDFVEIEFLAVDFAPVFLVGHRCRQGDDHFVFEARIADCGFLMLYTRVEGVERLVFLEHTVEIALPVIFAGIAFATVAGGIVALGHVGELKE